MLLRLIEDIDRALDAEAYMAALALVLTLPDICGKAAYGDMANKNRFNKKERYIKWFDENIGQYEKSPKEENELQMPYLSGEVVYSLRCSMLHQGNPNIDKDKIKDSVNKIDKFVLVVEKRKLFDIYADSSSLTDSIERQDGSYKTYSVNVRRLCLIICETAKHYFLENKDKFSFFNFEIKDWDKIQEEYHKFLNETNNGR